MPAIVTRRRLQDSLGGRGRRSGTIGRRPRSRRNEIFTPAHAQTREPDAELRASRRRLLIDGATIAAYAAPIGLVYGLAARDAGFSLLDTVAACVLVLAGGSQFAAVGLIREHAGWLAIFVVTALLNARHLLYSAALAPYVTRRRAPERAVMAHFLTDETFALALAHFRRLGRFDARGYWLASALIFFPWTLGSAAGYVARGAVVDPNRLGLDVAFPAAMAGLAVGMMSSRRELAAACGAVVVALAVGLAAGTAAGLVAGAVLGPLFGLALPAPREAETAEAELEAASPHHPGPPV